MLNRETLVKFQNRFEEEMKRIVSKTATQMKELEIPNEETADETDLTALELDQSLRMKLHQREASFLHKLEEGLARIADGSFGECEGCGEDIGVKRLEVRPTATYCVMCKEEEERKELLYMDGRKPLGIRSILKLA